MNIQLKLGKSKHKWTAKKIDLINMNLDAYFYLLNNVSKCDSLEYKCVFVAFFANGNKEVTVHNNDFFDVFKTIFDDFGKGNIMKINDYNNQYLNKNKKYKNQFVLLSKALHIVSPNNFPIIDSRVLSFCKLHYVKNKTAQYDLVQNEFRNFVTTNKFANLKKQFNVNISCTKQIGDLKILDYLIWAGVI